MGDRCRPMLGAYLPLGEAALLMGYRGRGWTRRLCREGRLPAIKSGGRWLVEREAALARCERRRGAAPAAELDLGVRTPLA